MEKRGLRSWQNRIDWWKFDLTLLQPYEWPLVLRHRPDFAEHCQCWGEWNDEMWCVLLRRQPQFADRFTGLDDLPAHLWCFLLRRQPQFAARFNKWNEMDADLWVKLLKDQQQFAERCPWEMLHGNNWVELLSVRPEFASHCDWGKLNDLNWVRLLVETGAEFAGKCDKWGIFSAAEWCELLGDRPDFSDRCDWAHFHWNELNEEQWMNLIDSQPQFIEKADSSAAIWRTVSVANWKRLLNKYPNLRIACERQFSCWEGLSVQDFLELISLAPGLVERCDWAHQWTADEQVEILKNLPAVRTHICFDKFSSTNWVDAVARFPELAEKCDWNIFTENEAVAIVSKQHHLIEFVPQGRIVARRSWIELSRRDETLKKRFLKKLDIGALDGRTITDILLELPELAEELPTNKIDDEIDKKRLATMQMELATRLWGGGASGWSKCYKWKGKDGIILGVCVQGDLFSLPPDIGRCDAIAVMEIEKRTNEVHECFENWKSEHSNEIPFKLEIVPITRNVKYDEHGEWDEDVGYCNPNKKNHAYFVADFDVKDSLNIVSNLGLLNSLEDELIQKKYNVVYLVDKNDANAFD